MRVEARSGKTERRILIGMLVDDIVCGKVSAKWDKEGLFGSRWSNLIGEWCVAHYSKYGKAPGKTIQPIFESWSEASKDKELTKVTERFLSGLSGEYEELAKEVNPEHTLDLSFKHFNEVKLRKLKDAIEGDLESGDLEKGFKKVNNFSKVEIGAAAGIDLSDKEACIGAFREGTTPLIAFPGDLGAFFGDSLGRDGLVSFMGPEKRGKTWWLLGMAWKAFMQKRKVAFFEVGDMSQNQIMRRFMMRAAKHPLKPQTVKWPISIKREPDDNYVEVLHEDKVFEDPLTWRMGFKAFGEVADKVKAKTTNFKLSTHPNSSLSVKGIKAILQGWERKDWVPDVIVIDYADLLAPIDGSIDTRDQINGTWKGLRALSQENHCLVITATQTDAQSYKAKTIDRTHFSEDKRKLAHVTGMVGLNATSTEKDMGVMRLNWVVLRESNFSEGKCVHVAGCLGIGNPCVLSTF